MFKYDPTVEDLKNAFEVAYSVENAGKLAEQLHGTLGEDVVEKVYTDAIRNLRNQMVQAGMI